MPQSKQRAAVEDACDTNFAPMILATVSQPKQLLHLSFAGDVTLEEIEENRAGDAMLLANLEKGFRLLVDLSQLNTMDTECAAAIGQVMELFDERGVGLIVRVIPNPKKDIGLNILSLFHYHHRPRIVTCKNLEEAGRVLDL